MNANIPSIDKERLLAHLDHNNPSTFEVEDLSRLIKQVRIVFAAEFLVLNVFLHTIDHLVVVYCCRSGANSAAFAV